jgi:hypothetical protein
MQLYNAALANKKGNASTSFEDWVHVSAAIQVFGYEAAMNQFGLSQGDWTTISAHWQNELTRDPMGLAVRRNQLQEQDAHQLRSGGQPRQIQVQRGPAGAPQAGGNAFDPNAQMAQAMAAVQPNQQAWAAHAAGIMGSGAVQGAMQMAGAMNVLGGGSQLIPGRKVMVQWSDGNQYPGTIMQTNGAQAQVTFPDGNQMWIETQYLTPA